MPDQPGNTDSRIAARIPTNKKDALVKLAHSRSTPCERITYSDLVREAVDLLLSSEWDDLPEEARDDLDADLKANAGGEDDGGD